MNIRPTDPTVQPNTKSREHDFHKLFKSLPDGETLIEDFLCALLRDILVQGRLYISQNWICFYSNILGFETLKTIEVRKIIRIKKEKTARVINNAISISTHEEKYFFSSFLSRDSAYNHMTEIWHDVLSLSDHGSRDTESMPAFDEDETCGCVSHYANEHFNQKFDMNIEEMYKLLFNDESSVQSEMITRQKMGGYEATSWYHVLGGANERTLNYRIPLNGIILGPQCAEVIEKQALTVRTNSIARAAKCYIVNCKVKNPNVPCGDKFIILKRYCLTRGAESTCKLRLTSDVKVFGRGMVLAFKSTIEKNSKKGIDEYCERLCMCLRKETAITELVSRKRARTFPEIIDKNIKEEEYCDLRNLLRTEEPAGPGSVPQARLTLPNPFRPSPRVRWLTTYVTDNYIAVILFMIAVLLILNLVLVYRLSPTTNNCNSQFDILNSLPHSEEGKSECIRILSQQQELHKKEIERR